jgi:hypothetical protein
MCSSNRYCLDRHVKEFVILSLRVYDFLRFPIVRLLNMILSAS